FLHGFGKAATDQLITALNLRGDEKVLEIGIGTGATQVRLKSKFPQLQLYGVDISEDMVNIARKRLKFCNFSFENVLHAKWDNQEYPWVPEYFDVVIIESVLAILSVDEVHVLLNQIHRILKPSGKLGMNE